MLKWSETWLVTEWEREMQAVLQTWETEFHTWSSNLRKEQQRTWSQRSVSLKQSWSLSFSFIMAIIPALSTRCCRTRFMCWRTPFPSTHSTTWSSSCLSLCSEYLNPYLEKAKLRMSYSVSLHTHTDTDFVASEKSLKYSLSKEKNFRISNKKRCVVIKILVFKWLENTFVCHVINNKMASSAFNIALVLSSRGRSHPLQDCFDLQSWRPHGVCSEEEHLYRLSSCAKNEWCVCAHIHFHFNDVFKLEVCSRILQRLCVISARKRSLSCTRRRWAACLNTCFLFACLNTVWKASLHCPYPLLIFSPFFEISNSLL